MFQLHLRTGWKAAEANVHPNLTANIIYAPALILFYISIFKNKHVSFLYVMAAIGVFLSILALPIVGGGSAPLQNSFCNSKICCYLFMSRGFSQNFIQHRQLSHLHNFKCYPSWRYRI